MLEEFLDKIRNFDIDKTNAKLIADFCRYCFANSLSLGRIKKYGYTLKTISKMLDKKFDNAKKKDIEELMIKLEQTDYTEHTKHDFKVSVKKFYRWLRKKQNPIETEWIKTTVRKNKIKLPSELLTTDDINKMIAYAKNPRDRAFIWVLYQSGCRIDEILNLKIKDVSFDEYSAIANVLGKTGSRRIRIFDNKNYLKFWLDNHKFKDNKESFVFTSISTNATNDRMDYHSVVSMLKTIAKKCDIKKPINPHQFRHSRATELANKLTEAQMCQMFGWVQGSNMPSVYVHLSGRDLDEPLMKLNNAYADNQMKYEEMAKFIQEDKELVKMIAERIAKRMKK
jgi:site-specific recombinase XerD